MFTKEIIKSMDINTIKSMLPNKKLQEAILQLSDDEIITKLGTEITEVLGQETIAKRFDLDKIDGQAKEADLAKKISECRVSRELIQIWMNETKTKWGVGRYIVDGISMSIADSYASFIEWCQYNGVRQVNKNGLLDKQNLTAGFETLGQHQMKELYSVISNRMDYEPNDEWQKLKLATAFDEEDIIILQSWIWNIKGAACNKSQRQVPMPMLFSSQQQWQKSTFCEKLYSPVSELAEMHDFSILQDKFYYPMWEKLLVVDFDEMGGMEKADINTFKKFMFAKHLSARTMHSQQNNKYTKRVQAIGSSNRELSEILWDTTGSRRVWQISLKKALGTACDTVDFWKLWQSVDMSAECPLYVGDNSTRIMSKQFSEQRRKSSVELFLDELLQENTVDFWGTKELFKEYDQWRIENKETEMQSRGFHNRMKELGYITEPKPKRINGKLTKYYALPKILGNTSMTSALRSVKA